MNKNFSIQILTVYLLSNVLLGQAGVSPVKTQKPVDPPVTSYLVINADTGDIIMKKNPEEPHAPASLTKLMTLYLTLEAIKAKQISWDQLYTATKRISQIGGSEARMWPGEKLSVRDLVKASAVGSANDAAAALAETISGSQEAFVEKMNQKAQILGLKGTFFRTPHGLPVRQGTPKDTTTAIDLARLSLAILHYHPEILQFTSSKETYIRNGKWRFNNTNKLIGKYPGINGLKTGFTNDAGFCLVATAKRENLHVISVLLGAKSNKERFEYTKQLLDEAFSKYKNISVPCQGQSFEIPIPNSENAFDEGIAQNNLFFMVPIDRIPELRYELFIPNGIEAPLPQGQKIAEYAAILDDKKIAHTDVHAKNEIKKAGFFKRWFGD
jgi:D-alanyl-D-alanine carboxypeptidase (penicillin-binding protein 5/6)